MKETFTRAAGSAVALAYAGLIAWTIVHQPQSFVEVTGRLSDAAGIYRIDDQAFADGLRFFRNDQFREARMAFERADPAARDAQTQFYIAYSFYREGWGRLYHDDRLYAAGLETIDRAMSLAPRGRLVVDDPALPMRTAEELKAELEAGLRREASDFNPTRLFEQRK